MTGGEDEDDAGYCIHCCTVVSSAEEADCRPDDTGFCIMCGRYLGGEEE